MTAAELLSLADTAEVNSVGQDGRTALHRAALLLQSCNRDEAAEVKKAIRVLLQHGATLFSETDAETRCISPVEVKRPPQVSVVVVPQSTSSPPAQHVSQPPPVAATAAGSAAKNDTTPAQGATLEKDTTPASVNVAEATTIAVAAKTRAKPSEKGTPQTRATVPSPDGGVAKNAAAEPQQQPEPQEVRPVSTEWVEPDSRPSLFVGDVRFEVVGCSVVAAKGKEKEHVRYTITVCDGATTACWWKVSRRYSDFEDLVKALRDPVATKHLPKKGWGLGGNKLKIANTRIKDLNLLVGQLQRPQHLSNPIVRKFFDVPT